MATIAQVSMENRSSVLVTLVILITVGMNAYYTLPREAAPDISIPVMLVQTVYPGVSPEDMENLVTVPIERRIKELRDIKELRSSSIESVSVVTAEFEPETDLDEAYQRLKDKVDLAKPDLPEDAEDPVIREINFSDVPVLYINLAGPQSLEELKRIGEDLEEQIERLPEVQDVVVSGGLTREYHVDLDPRKLDHFKLTQGDVINQIRNENRTTPAGDVTFGAMKFTVRVPGEFTDVATMRDIVVKTPGGRAIRLGEVAEVTAGYKEQESRARADGLTCVTLAVKKRTGENIIDMVDKVKVVVDEAAQGFPQGLKHRYSNDQSKFIREQVSDLTNNVISSLILVIAILFFTMGFSNAIQVAINIPLSMLITLAVLQMLGITLNMVVLFSLVLASGMLVDNAIVVVDNIYRQATEGKPLFRACIEATDEVAWPILSSTLTTVVAFAPLIFWPGITGKFMSFLPKTVIISLSASVFVAWVMNPVFASLFTRVKSFHELDPEGPMPNAFMALYRGTLRFALAHRFFVLGALAATIVAAVVVSAASPTGVEFFPSSDPEFARVMIKGPVGSTLESSDRAVTPIEQFALKIPDKVSVTAQVGGGGGDQTFGMGGGGAHQSVVTVEFMNWDKRPRSSRETADEIRTFAETIPGADVRVEMSEQGPPQKSPVTIRLTGRDMNELGRLARQVRDVLAGVPSVIDIRDDFAPGKPELRVVIDREMAKRLKLNTSVVADAVRTAVNGTIASKWREGKDEYDIIVRYQAPYRGSIADIESVRVADNDGNLYTLKDVAKVEITSSVGSVLHVDQRRTVTIEADYERDNLERPLNVVLEDVQKAVAAAVPMPAGYNLAYVGANKEQDEASAFLGKAFGVAVLLVFLVMVVQFNSVVQPFIIMLTVILAMMGVVIALVLFREPFGVIMHSLAVISLAGVVVNNGIVLITFINQLQAEGYDRDKAVVRAGLLRLRPVLLTAGTTVLGLIPTCIGLSIDFINFTYAWGSPSAAWWGPMSRGFAFGLAFATFLTLVVVPIMYTLLDDALGVVSNAVTTVAARFAPSDTEAAAEAPAAIHTTEPAGDAT